MRGRSKTHTSPEHWSKDFVEHLRTVHFALVAVSAGLIVLLSSVQYDAKAAAAQLAQVHAILTLWSKTYGYRAYFAPNDPSTTHPLGGVGYSEWLRGDLVRQNNRTEPSHKLYLFHLSGLNLFECHAASYRELDPALAPTTTQQFADWWNGISDNPMVVDSIVTFYPSGSFIDLKSGDDGPINGISPSKATGEGAPVDITMKLLGQCDLDDSKPMSTSILGVDTDYRYKLVVNWMGRNRITQQYVVDTFEGRVGKFVVAFPDLAKAAHHREDTDWATLTTQINAEAAKGSQNQIQEAGISTSAAAADTRCRNLNLADRCSPARIAEVFDLVVSIINAPFVEGLWG